MNPNRSIAEVVADMEAQLAYHESQEAFHAEQEIYHREQRAVHQEAFGKVRERYELFKNAVAAVGDVVLDRPAAAPSAAEPEKLAIDAGRPPTLAMLVTRLVEKKSGEERLTPSSITAELNERFAGKLPRAADGRAVSLCLRRLMDKGQLRLVRKGGAAHEAVYRRPAAGRPHP